MPPVVSTVTASLNVTVIRTGFPVVYVPAVEETEATVGEGVIMMSCFAKPSVPVAGRVRSAFVVGAAVSTMVPPLSANAPVDV